MSSILQIVDPSNTATVMFDLNDEDGSNNAAYGTVQTYLLHNPSWGAARLDAQRFEGDSDGGQTPFSRYGLTDCQINVRFKATSYDNLAAGVNRLSFLLSQGCTLKWVPNGSSVTKYVDIEPSQTPALVDGRELALYLLTSQFDTPEGVTLSLTRQPFFYQAELDPTLNILSNATLLVDSDGDGVPDGWEWNPFSPLDLAPYIWLDAVQISGKSDGDTMTTWSDVSGNSRNLTEATNPPTYKTNIVNGKPVVRFDGTNDRLSRSVASFSTTWTVAVVARKRSVPSGGDADAIWEMRDPFSWLGTHSTVHATDLVYGATGTPTNTRLTSQTPTVDSAFISVARLNSTSSMDFDFNGGTRVNLNPHDNAATPGTLYLGYNQTNGVWSDYDIAEFLLFSSALTDGDINTIEEYLAGKWGVTI